MTCLYCTVQEISLKVSLDVPKMDMVFPLHDKMYSQWSRINKHCCWLTFPQINKKNMTVPNSKLKFVLLALANLCDQNISKPPVHKVQAAPWTVPDENLEVQVLRGTATDWINQQLWLPHLFGSRAATQKNFVKSSSFLAAMVEARSKKKVKSKNGAMHVPKLSLKKNN